MNLKTKFDPEYNNFYLNAFDVYTTTTGDGDWLRVSNGFKYGTPDTKGIFKLKKKTDKITIMMGNENEDADRFVFFDKETFKGFLLRCIRVYKNADWD